MEKRRYFIWVDDERVLPHYIDGIAENFIVCKTYKQALNSYCTLGDVYLDLDHDLGCKGTGYDIAKYVVEHQLPLYGFACHSFNPVGKKNIEDTLLHYGYNRVIDGWSAKQIKDAMKKKILNLII